MRRKLNLQPETVEHVGTTQPAVGGYGVPKWMYQYGYTVPEYHPIHSNGSCSHSVYAALVFQVSAFNGWPVLETFPLASPVWLATHMHNTKIACWSDCWFLNIYCFQWFGDKLSARWVWRSGNFLQLWMRITSFCRWHPVPWQKMSTKPSDVPGVCVPYINRENGGKEKV